MPLEMLRHFLRNIKLEKYKRQKKKIAPWTNKRKRDQSTLIEEKMKINETNSIKKEPLIKNSKKKR